MLSPPVFFYTSIINFCFDFVLGDVFFKVKNITAYANIFTFFLFHIAING